MQCTAPQNEHGHPCEGRRRHCSLTQQIRITDDANVLKLAETKARYQQQHSPSSAHTQAAWEIVLDENPRHRDALENIARVK